MLAASAVQALAQTVPAGLPLNQASISIQIDGEEQVQVLGTRALPWRWDHEFNRHSGIARFEFQFDAAALQGGNRQTSSADIGLFGLSLGSRYRFRLNDAAWVEVGWQETTQYRARPRWHLISGRQLTMAAPNRLELEVRFSPASYSGLSQLELGEIESTLAKHQTTSNQRYFSALVASVSSLLIALLAVLMWFASREPFFLLTGLAEALFAIRQVGIFIDYPPLPTWLWNALFSQFFVAYVVLLCLASLLLVAAPAPRIKRGLGLFLGLALPTLWIGHWVGDYRAYLVCLAIMLGFTLICVMRISYFAAKTTDVNTRLFAISAWAPLLLGVHDFVVVSLLPTGFSYFRFGVFSSVLFNLGLAVIIVRRYLSTKQDLARSAAMAQIKAEQATLQERQRIMADIHDTVGAQLVGVLDLIRSGAAHQQLENETAEALQDLRIAIDAIQPVNGNLTAVLATLRHRLEPRLEAHNIELLWHVAALPRMDRLTPKTIQHIQRIVQEAISNVLTHAKATHVSFTAVFESPSQSVVIHITDDGLGFEESKLSSVGQGLRTLRFRADAIGAAIAWTPNEPQGTKLTLTLPIV